MSTDKTELRWGMERRLEFIEFRLFWEGHVNRGDITDTFGVSSNQASTDLNRYLSLAPDNMAYDKRARTYLRSPGFSPEFLEPNPNQYLTQLRSVSDGIIDQTDAWLGQFPEFETAPTPARGIDTIILRSLVAAIRRNEAIEVKYQSLSSPKPKWRWIAPHAIGFDGFRWHARAFCETDQVFKDFLISRVLETRGLRANAVSGKDDTEWHEFVTLEIGPHPDLSPDQRKIVELDYGMAKGTLKLPVRRAFLFYALKRLGLDTDPSARRPQDQQIILLNGAELSSGENK